jgi:hypothetical protein
MTRLFVCIIIIWLCELMVGFPFAGWWFYQSKWWVFFDSSLRIMNYFSTFWRLQFDKIYVVTLFFYHLTTQLSGLQALFHLHVSYHNGNFFSLSVRKLRKFHLLGYRFACHLVGAQKTIWFSNLVFFFILYLLYCGLLLLILN